MGGGASSEPGQTDFSETILHATTVALGDRGVLITGPSGSGKSALGLQLMGLGAVLVADDRTIVRAGQDGLVASAPDSIRGLIEARGVGLLNAKSVATVKLLLAVDLATPETERLPPWRSVEVCGHTLPVLHKIETPHFPSAILQYLSMGRSA